MRARVPTLALAGVLLIGAAPAAAPQTEAPLTLDGAIAEALRSSPELQPRTDQIALAEIQREAAASQFAVKLTPSVHASSDPVSGASRSFELTAAKQLMTGARVFATASSYSLGTPGAPFRDAALRVGLSQPLLRGFRAAAAAPLVDAARGVDRARRQLEAARAALVVRTSAAYFGVLKEERLVVIARQAAERAMTLTKASTARAAAGLATQLDILRAELLEAQLSAAVSAQEQAVATARDSLAALLGRPAGAHVDLAADDDLWSRRTELPPVDVLVARALGGRPEVLEARDRIGDARRAADVAKLNLLPPLSLDVSYARHGIGVAGGDAWNALLGGWRVGISSAYALDRGAERAVARAAAVSVAAADRAARLAERQVETEVRQLYRAWEAAANRIALSRQAVTLAERQLRLAELRFERGLGTSLEVVDAQTSVMQTAGAFAAAEMDRAVLTLDVQRAAGMLDPERMR